MFRRRAVRVLPIAVSVALLALSALSSGATLAAIPSVTLGSGPEVNQTASAARPAVVSAGDVAGFVVSLTNSPNVSTLSQLYLEVQSITPGGTVYGAVPSQGKCTTSPFKCTLGQLKPGKTATVTVAVQTPLSSTLQSCPLGRDGSVGFLATNPSYMCVDFVWTSTGTPGTDPSQSHGDQFHWLDGVSLSSDPNFAGRFVFDSGQTTVADNSSLGNRNQQSTSTTVGTGVPADVADGPANSDICDEGLLPSGTVFDCDSLTSEWSTVNVDRGRSQDAAFKIVISFFQLPNGLKGSNPRIYHHFLDFATSQPAAELITTKCSFTGGVLDSVPCLIVQNKAVTIWTTHNGGYRG